MGSNDLGTLPPAGTELKLSDVWFDGTVRFRPGGAMVAENGITSLPVSGTPATPASGSVQFTNSAGSASTVSSTGLVSVLGGGVQSQTTTVTVANTNALTSLQSFTVPANDPQAGSIYAMYGYGQYSDTGTPTLTFTLLWGGTGGTTLTTIPAITLGSSITNVPFFYRAIVNFRTATSAWANVTLNLATSAATGAVSSFTNTASTATTVTSNVASALTMGVTWSAASSSNTISLFGGGVERLA